MGVSGDMKKLITLIVLLLSIALVFSGCAAITNIFNPLPDNFTDGVKTPKDYPDDYLEIYDDAVVYEAEDDDGAITLMCGTVDEIDDVIKFYADLFDDDEFTINESDDSRGEYYAEGRVGGYGFEIFAEDAKGEYEERAFTTVVEVKTRVLGKDMLDKLQGFWLACGDNGMVSDEIRRMGLAVDFDGMKMDFYAGFEIDSTNIDFAFIDDDTIQYTEDGEEYTADIKFETIDGIDVLTMENEYESLSLEKSSYDKMMEYAVVGAATLQRMQGFWLACGVDGQLDDIVRMEGIALVFENYIMASYTAFEMDAETSTIEFIDDSTFTYYDYDTGTQEVLSVTFETIDGIEVMTISDGETAINLERSSEDLMWTYYDWADDELLYLDTELTDDDILFLIADADWTYSYYYHADTMQYEAASAVEIFTFYSTGYGEYANADSWYETTWYVMDGKLYVTIYAENEVYLEFYVDFEYDGTTYYMYLYNATDGFAGDAWVYTGQYR